MANSEKSIERGIHVEALKLVLDLARKDNTRKSELPFCLARLKLDSSK
jgi:hypothetical protein